MYNDLSRHLAEALIEDRLRAARRQRRAEQKPAEQRADQAPQGHRLLVRAAVLLSRLR